MSDNSANNAPTAVDNSVAMPPEIRQRTTSAPGALGSGSPGSTPGLS